MSTPCPTCLPLDCSNLEDSDLYSIESPIFGFVLNCPPGYDCGTATQINMVCCGQVLSAQFPLNATVDDKLAIIQELVNQCGVRQLFCGGPTTQLFYNRTKTCTVLCPDGSPFVYTVAAGTFLGPDQATVDQQAADFACEQAGLRKVCLGNGNIPSCLCVGVPYVFTITTTGGVAPLTWAVDSGALPPGLSLDTSGQIVGITTSSGNYSFGIKVTSSDGGFVIKNFTMAVGGITPATFDFPVGIGVLLTMKLVPNCLPPPLSWQITSGALPVGLTLNSSTGVISGTPGEIFTGVTIKAQSGAASCQKAYVGPTPPTLTLSIDTNSILLGDAAILTATISPALGSVLVEFFQLTPNPPGSINIDNVFTNGAGVATTPAINGEFLGVEGPYCPAISGTFHCIQNLPLGLTSNPVNLTIVDRPTLYSANLAAQGIGCSGVLNSTCPGYVDSGNAAYTLAEVAGRYHLIGPAGVLYINTNGGIPWGRYNVSGASINGLTAIFVTTTP